MSNIPSCAFMTSFFSETEIKSLPRLSLDPSVCSSGIVKRFHFLSKFCRTQTEPDTLLPKVWRKLRRTFRPSLSCNFNSFLVRIPFLWTWFHFRPVFLRTLWTISSLMDGGMSVFSITRFTQKFPTAPSKWLVFCEIVFFCWTNNVSWSSLIILSEICHWVFSILFHLSTGGCFWCR